jgi:hypothetical protein
MALQTSAHLWPCAIMRIISARILTPEPGARVRIKDCNAAMASGSSSSPTRPPRRFDADSEELAVTKRPPITQVPTDSASLQNRVFPLSSRLLFAKPSWCGHGVAASFQQLVWSHSERNQ